MICVIAFIALSVIFLAELDSQFMWIVVFEDLEEGYSFIGEFVTNLQKQGLALSVLLLRLLVLRHV